ncbi:DNA repair protein RecO [Vicingus serpentipes]|jgi:DNA repair protein RecO (recombination protein O)|uniref:DNA repair protein RecO n=1 Tax=Vicingus serpentipes TaxID=1926625 RepID=A0A5C6RRS4_9FLAO|nr:DNA repair protein RecO [Vicingus serpentipes]TXB64699.1 DNA repair protein RecO [Vicingus serpentipes]
MLHTTNGVVLNYFKYSENSVIAKIYTRKFGIQSYILKGLGNKKTKMQKAFLQPLSLVEITAYHKENKGLQSLNNIKSGVLFQSIPFNIYKSSTAFFLAECLSKLIKEEESNPEMFDFIYHAIEFFDLSENNNSNFHLIFLLQFTKYLGIYPQGILDENAVFFDLYEGVFKVLKPQHVYFCSVEESSFIRQLLNFNFNEEERIIITNETRKKLLTDVIEYFSLHSFNLKNIKSREVFIEVFS